MEWGSPSGPEESPRRVDPLEFFKVIRDLAPNAFRTGKSTGRSHLLELCLAVEETSFFSPALGREMSLLIAKTLGMPEEEPAGPGAAEILGSAAFVLEACYSAARKRNIFDSILMGSGKIQQDLADMRVALEFARFEVYRSLFLLDEGEAQQGTGELVRAQARIHELHREILHLAFGLLGESWLRKRFPNAVLRAAGPVDPEIEDTDERSRL